MARRGGLRSVAVMLAAGALLVGLGPTGVAAAAPPPNDKRADATVVGSLPFSDSVDVSGATRAASDPGACYNDILARWARTMHRTIWYRIPAPGADTLIVRVVASAGRPVLVAGRLISGRLVGDCQYTGRRDATGYMSYIDPGADAYVVIGLADDVPATLDVAIESGAAHGASNDAWQDATPIEQTPFVDRVDLEGATGSADDPTTCGGSQHTIWYRIRPAHGMRLEVSTSGEAPVVWILRRASGAFVTSRCVQSDAETADLEWTFQGGVTTYIAVGLQEAGHRRVTRLSDPDDPERPGDANSTLGGVRDAAGRAAAGDIHDRARAPARAGRPDAVVDRGGDPRRGVGSGSRAPTSALEGPPVLASAPERLGREGPGRSWRTPRRRSAPERLRHRNSFGAKARRASACHLATRVVRDERLSASQQSRR